MEKAPEVPSDEEVLAVIRSAEGGIAAGDLIRALVSGGHTVPNSITAIQRVVERGLVELGEGLTLVEASVPQRVAA